MNGEYKNFQYWQLLGHRCVENNGKYYHCNNEESTMPLLRVIAAIVQSDETLNLNVVSRLASLLRFEELRDQKTSLLCLTGLDAAEWTN